MVRRWLRLREEGWWWRVWFSGVGAIVTGVVLLTLAVTKFTEGAWIVVVLIPALVLGFVVVHRHYDEVAARSEEHTSELQSQSNLVCRLLLEKKKKLYRRRVLRLARPASLVPPAADELSRDVPVGLVPMATRHGYSLIRAFARLSHAGSPSML